ncbi:MAG: PAS domain S-box protein [Kineosporiaceae bacterium]
MEDARAGRLRSTGSVGLDDLDQSRLSVLAARALDGDDAAPELEELLAVTALALDVPLVLLHVLDGDRRWRYARVPWTPVAEVLQRCAADVVARTDGRGPADGNATAPQPDAGAADDGAPAADAHGAPLLDDDGLVLGALVVAVPHPGELDDHQRAGLRACARHAVAVLDLRSSRRRIATQALALARRTTSLRALLDHCPVPVAVRDAEGTLLLATPAAAELGAAAPDPHVAEEHPRLRPVEARALDLHRPVTDDETTTGARGERRELVTTAFPLPATTADGVPQVATVSVEIGALSRVRRRLARDEADLRALVETSGSAVMVVDHAGRVRWTNPAASLWRHTGGPGLRPAEHGVPDVVPEECLRWLREQAADGSGSGRLPGEWLGPGAPRVLHAWVHPVTWHDADAIAVEATDATAQEEVAAEGRRDRQRFEEVFHLAPVGMAEVDDERRITLANPAMERLMRAAPGSLTGRTVADLLVPESADLVRTFAAELASGARSSVRAEVRVLADDGSTWACLLAGTRVPGPPPHGLVHLVDVEEQHRALARARADVAVLEEAEHLSGVGSWARSEGDAMQWSPAMRALVGIPDTVEPTRDLWASLVEPEDRDAVAAVRADDGDEVGPFDLHLRCWDGALRTFEVRTRRRVPGSGADGAYVGIMRDVTAERARAGAAQRSASRALGLLDAAPDPVVVCDAQGRITDVSRQVTAQFGWAAQELIGRPVETLVPPELHGAHRAHRAAARLDDGPRVMHGSDGVLVVTRDGRRLPVEVTLAESVVDGRRTIIAGLRDVSRTRALQHQVTATRDLLLEVLDGSQDQAILSLDAQGRIGSMVSAGATRILGLAPAALRGRLVGDLFDAAELRERAREMGIADPTEAVLALADRPGTTSSFTWRRTDGTPTRVAVSVRRRQSGVGYVVVATDVEETNRTRQALAASEARFRAAFRDAPVAMAVVSLADADAGTFLQANAALCRLLGRGEDAVVGHHFNEFTHPDDQQIGRDLMRLQRRGQVEHWEIEKRYVRADGEVVWVKLDARVSTSAQGRPDQVVIQFEDVGRRREMEADLAHRALHDALTGLPNAELMREHLTGALARARRTTCPVGVLLVDLDDLKLVNDSLGTSAGDAVLVAVAERLRGALRDVDFAARSGGDEFVVIAENLTEVASVEHLADRVLAAIHAPVDLGDHTVTPTASVGIALSGPTSTPVEVVADAEGAMYGAKASGKSRWSQADKGRRDLALRQITLEHELRTALEERQLFLVYQPVYDLARLAPVAVEALVRWRHPHRGVVGPDQFLDVAEARDLIRPLGTWVLREACRQGATWARDLGARAPQVWVNVSARQLGGAQLHREVRRALADSGLPGELLHVELTERQLVDLGPSVRSDLHQMRDLGVGLAIDDWGTGHNGIEHLRHLPATALKIDRSFTAGLGRDRTDTALTVSIVALARELGLTVVAEGIETPDQLARLQQLGAPLGQGFHFSRPLEVDAATRLTGRQPRPSPGG